MKTKILKLLMLPLLLIFINIGFLLSARELFTQPQILIPILSFNLIICADITIRPISREKDEYNRVVVYLSFLAMPIIVFLPYLENKVLTQQLLPHPLSTWILVIGTGLLLIGGILMLVSRFQLGEVGGTKIIIEEGHQLITTGIYSYIRHPIYLGFLLLFFGYSLALGSIITTGVITIALFLIFRSRMGIEEKLLLSSFGEEYSIYLKRTERLIPFLY